MPALPLSHLELIDLSIPRRYPFHSAVGTRTVKRALLVRWWCPDGSSGVGEFSGRADPFFSGEFLDGAVLMLQDHLAPLLSAAGTLDDLVAACSRIRGWPFATGAVLFAALDALRRQGTPDAIDRWPHRREMTVPVGISLGLYPTTADTLRAVEGAAQRGFRRVKLKVSPQTDPRTLHAVRAAHPALPLSLDANGCFSEAHLDHLAALTPLRLLMLEQPFPPGRLDLDRALKERAPDLPICLDESLTDAGAIRTAHALGVLDIANLKPGRLGGPLTCEAALRWCQRNNVSAWIGGMFETGIGRHANLRAASCLPDALAHDISPPSRYLAHDLLTEPLEMSADGTIALEDAPVEVDWSAVERFCQRRIRLLPGQP